MSGASVSIKMDTAAFEAHFNRSARETVNAIRSSVDRAARVARKQAVEEIPRDMNVSKSKVAGAFGPLKRTTQSNLSASWTINRSKVNLASTLGAVARTKAQGGGVIAATHVLTGGGSSSISAPKAALIVANGGRFALDFAKVPTRGLSRLDRLKAAHWLSAALTTTTMSQDDARPRVDWERTADRELSANLGAKIQQALDGASVALDAGA